MSERNFVYVACDNGHAEYKLTFREGGELKNLSFPARVRPGEGRTDLQGNIADCYRTEGSSFTVVKDGEFEDTRFAGYPTSKLSRVMVHHGLALAGLGGRDVVLATGLPFTRYFNNRRPDKDLIKGVTENLAVDLTLASRASRANIIGQKVYAEGMSAVYDYISDFDGNIVNEPDRIGVVDIGGRTTDIVTMVWERDVNAALIEHDRCSTTDLGVLNIIDHLQRSVRDEYNLGDDDPIDGLTAALTTKRIKIFGASHDVSGLVERAVQETTEEIINKTQRYLKSGSAYDVILFCGGGAALMRDVVTAFPRNGKLMEEPSYANSRGMLKALMLDPTMQKHTRRAATAQ